MLLNNNYMGVDVIKQYDNLEMSPFSTRHLNMYILEKV